MVLYGTLRAVWVSEGVYFTLVSLPASSEIFFERMKPETRNATTEPHLRDPNYDHVAPPQRSATTDPVRLQFKVPMDLREPLGDLSQVGAQTPTRGSDLARP